MLLTYLLVLVRLECFKCCKLRGHMLVMYPTRNKILFLLLKLVWFYRFSVLNSICCWIVYYWTGKEIIAILIVVLVRFRTSNQLNRIRI